MTTSKLAISSISLGRAAAGHSLRNRLREARHHGYQGIEIFHEEILHLCSTMTPSSAIPENQLKAAKQIKSWCDAERLPVASLQPFMHYEGLLNRDEHRKRLAELALWLRMAKILDTDMILIPSTFLKVVLGSEEDVTTGIMAVIVSDLRAAADTASSMGIRIAYEALCWGTHVNTWEQSWEVVRLVDRPNFGLCLDTFNLGGWFADPAASSGFIPGWKPQFEQSMRRLGETVDVERLFLVQLVDATRMDRPIARGHELHDESQPARMSWARNRRLFYGEHDKGGYLPVKEMCDVIFNELGYEGWVSFELFHEKLWDRDEGVAEEMAGRGMRAWGKLLRDLEEAKMKVEEPSSVMACGPAPAFVTTPAHVLISGNL
ncbi:3-dehydroshikimate dehydratase [Zalerion maritima]|uniref:3-dehydroshikimate dehydratase n=1 Tax=Zalerion maritima TaxID=339359 RepID=A0AAD5RKH1_9PEZI|nr:3-dehydroshikimate dehydratase [Zalerion maritima]